MNNKSKQQSCSITTIALIILILVSAFYYESRLNELSKNMQTMQYDFNQFRKQLYIAQLLKIERNMHILARNSKKMVITFSQNIDSFKNNFNFNKEINSIKKVTNQQNILYSLIPILDDSIYYYQVKIKQTRSGFISIGVLTHVKLTKNIGGYYMHDQMYYYNGRNGMVFHGSQSKKTRFDRIKTGDVISVFIDRQQNQVDWYVNGKYAESHYLQQKVAESELYPFIIMTTKDDEIIINLE